MPYSKILLSKSRPLVISEDWRDRYEGDIKLYLRKQASYKKLAPMVHNYMIFRRLRAFLSLKRQEKLSRAAVAIQRDVRRRLAINQARYLALVKLVSGRREFAAAKI